MQDENNNNNNQNNNDKYKMTRYVGKVKGMATQYGTRYSIHIDNYNAQLKDGSPNTHFKGSLVWFDAETGKGYQVKQMSMFIPKNGMPPKLVEMGYSQYVTLNLEDDYQITVLG
jgi:hypothetical protein